MTYEPQLPLYTHQQEALQLLQEHPNFALFMAMRTGKSAVIIAEYGMKLAAGEAIRLLIIAPAGVYRTWEVELQKHLPPDIYASLCIAVWQSKEKTNCKFYGNANSKRDWDVFIVNVEAMSTVKDCIGLCKEFLTNDEDVIMVVDESTTIKSPTSKRTLNICELAPLAKYRRILSGLPTPKSPLDTFAQFWFLDPLILSFRNYRAFQNRYAVLRKIKVGTGKTKIINGKSVVVTREIDIVNGYQNLDELQDKIANHFFRVRLEDCYDVPPKVYVQRDVELTAEQKRMYDQLKRHATTQLASGEHVTATETITIILRLHQLCCGWLVDEDGEFHTVKSNRLNELSELLADYDGKAVIWCSYHYDIDAVLERLRKEYGPSAVAEFHGDNPGEREAESLRFQVDPDCRWMVATPGSGGRGRTWSVAGLIVYYSNTDNLEHRDQSEERASSIDKADRVTVVDLITRDTVEEKIIHALRNKIDLAATITGDSWREWIV